MSSSFDADEVSRVSNDPFGENGYTGSDPQSPSHGYASYAAFSADEDDKDPIHISADASGFVAFVHEDISPTPEGYGYLSDTHLGFDSAASPFAMQNSNGSAYDEQMNAVEYLSDGPILQSPDEMHSDQGFFRREWRR